MPLKKTTIHFYTDTDGGKTIQRLLRPHDRGLRRLGETWCALAPEDRITVPLEHATEIQQYPPSLSVSLLLSGGLPETRALAIVDRSEVNGRHSLQFQLPNGEHILLSELFEYLAEVTARDIRMFNAVSQALKLAREGE